MKKIILTTSLALAISSVVACTGSENVNENQTSQASQAEKPTVEYLSPGKPQAALALSHSLREAVMPGESGVVTISIEDAYDAGEVVLTASATDGLTLSANSSQASFTMAGAATNVWDIFFNAGAAGTHYIDIHAVVTGVEGASTLSYSVPVSVGTTISATKPSNPDMVTTADGKNIIMMEAEETIEE